MKVRFHLELLPILAMPGVVSCKWVWIMPWIPLPHTVRLDVPTVTPVMSVPSCRVCLQWVSVLSKAESYQRGAGSALCPQNLLLLILQLTLSAKIGAIPLSLLLQSKGCIRPVCRVISVTVYYSTPDSSCVNSLFPYFAFTWIASCDKLFIFLSKLDRYLSIRSMEVWRGAATLQTNSILQPVLQD